MSLTEFLEIILISFGIIPATAVFVYKAIVFFSFTLGHPVVKTRISPPNEWYHVPMEVPWKNIGGSIIESSTRDTILQREDLRFSTLHCKTKETSRAKWLLEIEFEIRNPISNEQIVIDDIHARIFEKNAFAPPLATASFFGDVWLRQDNTILKEKRIYSLPPGDGYRINLMFEVTRIQAAPAYGAPPSESKGRATVIFGILLDYYYDNNMELVRKVIPSDCIYVFSHYITSELRSISQNNIDELKRANSENKSSFELVERIEKYLAEHTAFRAIPNR